MMDQQDEPIRFSPTIWGDDFDMNRTLFLETKKENQENTKPTKEISNGPRVH